MSKKAAEHHKHAAEHHTHAAHHHREAAKHHDSGHHEKLHIMPTRLEAMRFTRGNTPRKLARPIWRSTARNSGSRFSLAAIFA
jgi:hypothetical protein